MVEASPRRNARIAGTFYLLTFLTGLPAFFIRSRLGVALGLIAGTCYIVVTLLFYYIFKPVNRRLSLLAAILSLVGCAIGPVAAGLHFTLQINPLVFFGFYCLLIGYLILRSTFLPSMLGALMVFAGLGWLTFLSPPLATHLSPYNLIPGLIGEGALTVWLLAVDLNDQRWKEQATRSV
jgi:MFS family permease